MNIIPLWLLHLYLFYYVFTENLALHQSAWQSSTWKSDTADLAVDGQYTHIEHLGWDLGFDGQCAQSNGGQTTVEWRVDLGGIKNIHHVFVQHVNCKSIMGIIYFKITLLSKMNRCYTQYSNFRHKCRLNVNSPSKCKSCIMCVRPKHPDIPIHLILIKLA